MTPEKQRSAHEAGLKRRRQIAFDRAREAQRMARQGMSVGKIAEHFGVSPRTIGQDLKKDLTLLIENPEIGE